jgi:hypothetical protein
MQESGIKTRLHKINSQDTRIKMQESRYKSQEKMKSTKSYLHILIPDSYILTLLSYKG